MERLREKGADLGFGQRATQEPVVGVLGWVLRGVHLAVWAVESLLDAVKRPVLAMLGWGRPRAVLPFDGWVSESGVLRLGCRVLAVDVRARRGAAEADTWWRNLRGTLRRWDTRELPGVAITATPVGVARPPLRGQTDREGYGWFDVQLDASTRAAPPSTMALRAHKRGHAAEAVARVFHAPAGCGLGIISDVDDTVLHTGITNLLTAAKLTFLRNARTRTVLPGAPALYRALAEGFAEPLAAERVASDEQERAASGCREAGRALASARPIFYISSSAWNLHDLLTDFIAVNGLPPGPLLLRDLGVDRFKLLKSSGHDHKLRKAERVLDDFPSLRFVLLGDSGQADPELYAELAALRPGRVAAILIRDIDADEAPGERDARAKRHLDAAGVHGVPSFLVKDSAEAAAHLVGLRLLDASVLPGIIEETEADLGRPTPLGAAVRNAGGDVPLVPKRVVELVAGVAERLDG